MVSSHSAAEQFMNSLNLLMIPFLATLNNPDYVLHFLLPAPKVTGDNQRKRIHCSTSTATQSFCEKEFYSSNVVKSP